MKLWPAILSQMSNSVILSQQSKRSAAVHSSELLCGSFCSRCSPLPRLISYSKVQGQLVTCQVFCNTFFSQTGDTSRNFFRSCSPLSRLISWLFAFPQKRYFAIKVKNLMPAFFTQTGATQRNFVLQLLAQTSFNQLAVHFPTGIAT